MFWYVLDRFTTYLIKLLDMIGLIFKEELDV